MDQVIRPPLKPLQNLDKNTYQNSRAYIIKIKEEKTVRHADSTGNENDEGLKMAKHHHSVKKPQTASVRKRNARERNRIMGVNNGFDVLRKHVPSVNAKCSKVETLRGAISY